MATENIQNRYTYKRNKKRIVLLVIYSLVLLILFFYLISLNFNPFIVIFGLSFLFLVGLGLFFKGTKRSLYSEMFPDRKRKSSVNKRTRMIREKTSLPRIPGPINLEIRSHKPLIKKCQSCGNILPSFVKKCPFCNKQIS
ncbi:MAG: hypothetical protein ACFE9Q_06150 [Candidatus Hodarchaeota archaeon]